MAETKDLVKTVIQVLNDGSRGFNHLGEHLSSPELKTYFFGEAGVRAQFAQEVREAAGWGDDVGGTTSGTVHRWWGDLKASVGGSDHTLLETAEQGEDAAKKAYREALEDRSLDSKVRSVLERQQAHIQASHDKVKAYRDGFVA